MQIFICDDDVKESEKMKNTVQKYSDSHPWLLIKIETFATPFDFSEYISKNGAPDIALLDICMPGISGTDLAREINRFGNNSTDIIFLSSSPDYAVESYTLHSADYILKPYTEKALWDSLDRVVKARIKHSYALIKCESDVQKIDLYSVMYAQADHNFTEICLKSGKHLKARMSLTKFSELYDNTEGFCAVGASYFINFSHVSSMNKDFFVMADGYNIPIPRRLKSELKEKLFEFYKNETFGKGNTD